MIMSLYSEIQNFKKKLWVSWHTSIFNRFLIEVDKQGSCGIQTLFSLFGVLVIFPYSQLWDNEISMPRKPQFVLNATYLKNEEKKGAIFSS